MHGHRYLKLYIKLGPHKLHNNKQATTQYDSPLYAEVPEFMGSINMFNMNTLCGTRPRTRSPRIRNYTDNDGDWSRWKFFTFTCHAMAQSYGAHRNTATETTFAMAHDSCNVQK